MSCSINLTPAEVAEAANTVRLLWLEPAEPLFANLSGPRAGELAKALSVAVYRTTPQPNGDVLIRRWNNFSIGDTTELIVGIADSLGITIAIVEGPLFGGGGAAFAAAGGVQ